MRGAPARIVVVLAWGMAFALPGCGGGEVEHPEAASAFERMRDRNVEEPAASIAGRSVGAAEFQRYWEGRPGDELDEVVEAVVQRELAVQRATEQGVHREENFGTARKRAMVRELLRREVEGAIGPSDLERSEVERIESDIRSRLGRPAGIRASHLVVVPGSSSEVRGRSGGGSVGSAEEREEARRWATEIRRELPEEPSVTELFEVRRRYRDRIPENFELVVDAHLEFPSPDARTFEGDLPEGWMPAVEAFANEADRLLDEGLAGGLSEPVESRYGWHLIRPEQSLGARVPDPEATREVAVSKRLRERRRKRFEELWKRWRARASIGVDPSAIEEGR